MTKFAFCVDSDGCVMDTMTFKHEEFFGPLAADEFEVADRETFQKNWEDINLYSRTRGVNRFVGLVMGLDSVGYEGIDALKAWVENTDSLSNDSLKAELDKVGAPDLQKAYDWSLKVNEGIANNEHEDEFFKGSDLGLKALSEVGNVHIVSSANTAALDDEWGRHNLLQYVTEVYGQERGKKEDVIAGLIKDGQPKEKIIMIGDAPGDLKAAELNDVMYYPIRVGKEEESWKTLIEEELDSILDGSYRDGDQAKFEALFWDNLDNH